MNLDVTPIKKIAIFVIELFDRLHDITYNEFMPIPFCLNLSQAQNSVDIVAQTICVLDHIPDVFELIFPGQFISLECLQVKLQ